MAVRIIPHRARHGRRSRTVALLAGVAIGALAGSFWAAALIASNPGGVIR